MSAPLPAQEVARLASLLTFAILDTPRETEYDELAKLAAGVCETPIAAISLIDADRQWFKASVGLEVCETSRDVAFCSHAILQEDLLVVEDATGDSRFASNPLVTGGPRIRFYAGMPLISPEGYCLGTLCVIDQVPRRLNSLQTQTLRVLGRQVVTQLLLRRQVDSLTAAADERRASEESFRSVVEGLVEGVVVLDRASRRVVRSNRAFRELLGYEEAELAVMTKYDFAMHDRAVIDVDFKAVEERGRMSLGFRKYRRKDGSVADVSVSVSPLQIGGFDAMCLVVQDMTEQKLAENALRASEAKFRGTIDRLAEGVLVIDVASGRFVEANAASLLMLGRTHAELSSLRLGDVLSGETPDIVARDASEMARRLASDGRCDLGRRLFRRKDGTAVPVDLRVTLVPGLEGDLYAVIARDVTDQVAYENELFEYQSKLEDAVANLKVLASTDGLTQLCNRSAFDIRLAEECERASRRDYQLSVALIDVDYFKLFNDQFGHPAGDEVLRNVAEILRQTSRATDVVARYGGEEFALVLPDTDAVGGMVIAERCRRAIAAADWAQRPITISVGLATRSAEVTGPGELLCQADEALYRSKQLGRNRVSGGPARTAVLV